MEKRAFSVNKALLITTGLLCTTLAQALVVNIDINANESYGAANRDGTHYTGQGVFADAGNDYWNGLTIENPSATGLLASDGTTATAINVVISGGGGFVDTVITNYLLSDYFYNPTTTTISGLDANTDYTVYVYAVGDQPGQGSTITIGSDVQSTTGLNEDYFSLGGNYLIFQATADLNGVLLIGSSDKINGLQIMGDLPEPPPEPASNFVHPGISHKRSDLDRMKAMVEAKIDPWYTSYQTMSQLSTASYDYTVQGSTNLTVIYRDSPYTNKNIFEADSRAAYYNALRWYIEGDERYAQKAVECLNAWSGLTYVQYHGTSSLTSNMIIVMLEAAELIKSTYSGWLASDIQRFKDMLVHPGYSNTTIPPNLSVEGTWYWRAYMFDHVRAGNQELCGIRTTMAIGVFLDNEIIYDRALRYVSNLPHRPDDLPYSPGPNYSGSIITQTAYQISYNFTTGTSIPDYGFEGVLIHNIYENGQNCESSRDQGHTSFSLGLLCSLGEIAWNQGDNFWAEADDRLLAGLEYTSRYNISYLTSYPDQPAPWEPTVASGEFIEVVHRSARTKCLAISPIARGTTVNQYTWELPVAHYIGRGLKNPDDAKWTIRARDYSIIHNGNYEVGPTGGAYLGYGGLTFRRPERCYGDPISGFTSNNLPEYEMHHLPGTLEVENYDYFTINGEGRTFHDTTTGNSGNEYRRDDDVDIALCSEGGYQLTDLDDGEWVSYTVNVAEGGKHSLRIRYAGAADGAIRFAFDGSDVTGNVILPATGSATTWATYTVAENISLRQGVQSMRIYISGTSGAYELNSVTVTQEGITDPVIRVQAEAYVTQSGISTEGTTDVGGGQNIGNISHGNWCRYGSYALGEKASIRFRFARPNERPAGHIEVRLDSTTGTLVGSFNMAVTGGWQFWDTFEIDLDPVSGSHPIYLVFVEDAATPTGTDMCNLNWFELVIPADPATPSGLTADPATAAQVDLSWDPESGISGYNLKRASVSGGPYEVMAIGPGETSYTDTGLWAGSNYYYVVSAVLNGVESGNSAEVSAGPSAPINPEDVVMGSVVVVDDGGGGQNFSMSVPISGLGHNYRVQASDSLTDPDWQVATDVLPGNGGELQIDIPINFAQTNRFYKLEVWRQ